MYLCNEIIDRKYKYIFITKEMFTPFYIYSDNIFMTSFIIETLLLYMVIPRKKNFFKWAGIPTPASNVCGRTLPGTLTEWYLFDIFCHLVGINVFFAVM